MDGEKKSFIIYKNWMEMIMGLPDDMALDLVRTIFAYCLNRDYTPDPPAAAIFDTFEPILESDIEKWHKTREERVKAGSLGGKANAKQKVANAKQMLTDVKQMQANGKQNEPVYVNVNDNVNVNVNGNVDVNDNALDKSRVKKEETYVSKKEIVDALMAKWNSYTDRGSIPFVERVVPEGKTWKSVLARVSENGIDNVVDVMNRVFESDFLRGLSGNGDRWVAKFDWMFLPSNFEKIINGNYSNVKAKTEKRNVMQEQNDMLSDWVEEYDRIQYGEGAV